MAGTIAAARNGIGIVGVAPNVRMASVKVVNDAGFIYPEYAVCGFVWAGLKHMDVTNNSYYVDPFMYYCEDQPDQYAAKEAVRRAVALVDRARVSSTPPPPATPRPTWPTTRRTRRRPDDSTPVTRTINSGCHDIPTELDGVVTVSSMQRSQPARCDSGCRLLATVVSASSTSRRPARRSCRRSSTNNGYGLKSGTSMASPHVAGVLALMKSVHPHVDAGADGREARGPGRRPRLRRRDRRPGLRRSGRPTTATSVRASSTPSTP